jgi:hypothetical protein
MTDTDRVLGFGFVLATVAAVIAAVSPVALAGFVAGVITTFGVALAVAGGSHRHRKVWR